MQLPFLPASRRWAGYLSIAGGLVLGGLWSFARFKPDFLNLPVFAIYSSFVKKTRFGISQTNLTDEIAMILILAGLFWLVFSKEKTETPETDTLRLKAFLWSVFANTALLVFGILFFFGIGFLQVMVLGLFSQPTLYLMIFRILKYRARI